MGPSDFKTCATAVLVSCLVVLTSVAWASELQLSDPGLNSAVELYRGSGAEAALPEFERLIERFTEENRNSEILSATRYLGELHWRMGNFGESRQFLDSAVTKSRSAGNQFEEAKSLNVLGLLEWDEGRYEAALAAFAAAFDIADSLDDPRMKASVMNNRALVLDELGRYDESLRDYEKAFALFELADDLRGQGDALGNIGGVHLLAGRFREALKYYERALDISRTLESRTSMTIDNGNLGMAHSGLGNYSNAMRHFDTALSLAEETGMRVEEAYWRRGKAGALEAQGRYDEALGEYGAALKSARDAGAPALELDSLTDRGNLLLDLGDIVSASEAFEMASEIANQIGMPQGITINHISLGNAQMARKQAASARSHYQLAAQRAEAANEPGFEAAALARLAMSELEMGLLSEAAASAGKAANLAGEAGAVKEEAEAWLALAGAARLGDDMPEAKRAYDKAAEAAGDDPELSWQVHHGRAIVLAAGGEEEKAIDELTKAIEVIEGVRTGLANKRFRSGWMQNKYQVYVDLVRLQLGLGRQNQAFMSAERLRAQIYLAMVHGGGLSGRTERQKQEEKELRARITQLLEVLVEERSYGMSGRRQAAIDYFSSEQVAAERQYLAFLDDLGENRIEQSIKSLPPLANIQNSLNPSEALLEYLVADDGLVIFVLTQQALHAFTDRSGHGDLAARTNLLRELIANAENADWIGPAGRLSSILLEPVASGGFLESVDHLVIVPHGILNHIPFALLPSPGRQDQLLVDNFTISYLPTAAALVRNDDSPAAGPSVLAMAPQSARLRYAPGEARSVASVFPDAATLLEGRAATESAFKNMAPDHQVIHLATHGVFNHVNPLLSALELEADELNDGMLEVHEILGLRLEADLVTLSACQTALGSGWFNRLPAGDEFVGLARAFMQAGSQSILASLWEVDDRSTVSLMEGFYRGLGQDGGGLEKAAALARIQRELRASEKYSHPFYWAPFVLMGGHGTSGTRS